MVLDTLFPSDTASCRRPASPNNSEYMRGFLISRDVIDSTQKTLKEYKYRLNQFNNYLHAHYGDISLPEVRRTHVEAYLLSFKKAGRSPETVKTYYSSLRALFNWMIEESYIQESPMKHIKLPHTPKKGKPFLSDNEFRRLLDVCILDRLTGARNAAMIWLLWTTGMRHSELAGLNLSDLDWERNKIRVYGKGRKERYVPFLKEAKKAVWRYVRMRKDEYPQLWLTEERRPLGSNGIKSALLRLYRTAGFKVKDQAHIFRRTWAMRNLQKVPPKYVQLVGGWEDYSTMERYVQAMESEQALGANWT